MKVRTKNARPKPGKSLIRPLLLERFGFFFVEIGDDAVDVQVDDGLATFGGEEEGAVFLDTKTGYRSQFLAVSGIISL